MDSIAEAKRAADANAKVKLDKVLERFSGPYKVNGAGDKVFARPMFRMNGEKSLNKETADAHKYELRKICTKYGVSQQAMENACVGRPTPEQLVKVTQALIDAGKLKLESGATTEERIRNMQNTWGIGMDCAGYVREAAIAVHGDSAQVLVGGKRGENRYGAIDRLLQTRAFKKIDISDIRSIRTGDIIHLEVGQIGHNAIVQNHEVLTPSMRAKLSARYPNDPKLANFLNGEGPIHVLSVDSSWGISWGVEHGGFRRDTWIYDESAEKKKWGYFTPDGGIFVTGNDGPIGEKFTGAFRPTSAK